MPRIRTIKPELFLSETVSRLSLGAERTFIGLLTQADDRGRFRDSPPVLNGALWPCRPEHSVSDMESDLDEIVGEGLLCRYQVGGKKYLHFSTWEEHQKISHPSTRNLCPPCPEHDGETPRKNKPSGKLPEASPKTPQGKERKGKELVKLPTLSTEGGPGGTTTHAPAARSLPANAGGTKKRVSRKTGQAHKNTTKALSSGEGDEMGIYDEPVDAFADLRSKGAVTRGKKPVGKNGVSPKYLADAEKVIEHIRQARAKVGASTRVTANWWSETQSLLRGTASRSALSADQICDIVDFATADKFWHAHIMDPKGVVRHGMKVYLSDEFVLWSVAQGKPSANRPRDNAVGQERPSSRKTTRRRIDPDAPTNTADYREAL